MLIGYIGNTGKTIYATVKRLEDGYYLHNSSLTFVSAPTFANKRLTLSEGSSEEAGYYSYTVDSSGWDDGLYEVKIHDGDNSNIAVAGQEVAMMNGVETTLGNEIPVYHMDINFVKDTSNSSDEYLVTMFKNGTRITSGLSSVTLTVVDFSGTSLINAQTMTEISSGRYKYTATLAERQTAGNVYFVSVSATYNGSTISYSWNLGRDV